MFASPMWPVSPSQRERGWEALLDAVGGAGLLAFGMGAPTCHDPRRLGSQPPHSTEVPTTTRHPDTEPGSVPPARCGCSVTVRGEGGVSTSSSAGAAGQRDKARGPRAHSEKAAEPGLDLHPGPQSLVVPQAGEGATARTELQAEGTSGRWSPRAGPLRSPAPQTSSTEIIQGYKGRE